MEAPKSPLLNEAAAREEIMLRCTPRQHAHRRSELLGVWNGREFSHPTFQFHPVTGQLMPEMKTLLEILPKDRSGWRQAFWVYQGHRQLKDACPADVFATDPQAVIKAARSDFEISDERW